MRTNAYARLLALLVCVGCADPTTEVEVVFNNTRSPANLADRNLLRVQLEVGDRAYRIAGNELRTDRYATPHSDRLELPSRGELTIAVALVAGASDTLGAVRTSIPLQADYRFGVSVTPGGVRPVGACVGRLTSALLRRPGSPSAVDTLWVSVGGLPRGAVC